MALLPEAEAPARTRHLVVVYQMGKVGSTSIVNALNACEGVEAVQPHFLGARALHEILDRLIDPSQPGYFQHHRMGQFIANIDVTRQLEAARGGIAGERRLTVLSLVREPIDWFRSCLVQDIEGYIPMLRRFAAARAISPPDEDALIRLSLPEILGRIADGIESAGGIDACATRAPGHRPRALDLGPELATDLAALTAVFLRPFTWLDEHLLACLGFSADRLTALEPGVRHADLAWADLFLLRYEDIALRMPAIADRLGIPDFRLGHDNRSAEKRHARAVRSVFASTGGERLGQLARDSAFAQRFDYGINQ